MYFSLLSLSFAALAIASPASHQLLSRQDAFPQPHQPHVISSCTAFYKVQSGDNCNVIAHNFGNFTVPQFESWNPDVLSDCSNLELNYYVCIGTNATSTPTPTPTSTPPTTTTPSPTVTCTGTPVPTPGRSGPLTYAPCCTRFYIVKDGDTCVSIEKQFSITDAQFRSWNIGLDDACVVDLWASYLVCVAH